MSLLSEYKSSLKNVAVEEYVDLVIFRPLAFAFVKAIYATRLTPNQVTLLSMIVGVSSGVFFALGVPAAIILGGILLGAATVLDCADGQLARLKKNGTHLGRVLDGVVDYVYTISAFVGIALGCRNGSMGPWLWWGFVAAAGASYAVQAGLLDYYRNEYLAHVCGKRGFLHEELGEMSAEQEKLALEKGRYIEKFLLLVYLRYSKFQNQLTAGEKPEAAERSPSYAEENSVMIRLWSLNGTSTHVFVLILCALANRVDFFLWYILIFGSVYYLALHIIQKVRSNGG
jgi:CDP-alcohol phosphatidyltransferase